jgi:hypothetical protein
MMFYGPYASCNASGFELFYDTSGYSVKSDDTISPSAFCRQNLSLIVSWLASCGENALLGDCLSECRVETSIYLAASRCEAQPIT